MRTLFQKQDLQGPEPEQNVISISRKEMSILTNAVLCSTLSTANSIPPVNSNQKTPPKSAKTGRNYTAQMHYKDLKKTNFNHIWSSHNLEIFRIVHINSIKSNSNCNLAPIHLVYLSAIARSQVAELAFA